MGSGSNRGKVVTMAELVGKKYKVNHGPVFPLYIYIVRNYVQLYSTVKIKIDD